MMVASPSQPSPGARKGTARPDYPESDPKAARLVYPAVHLVATGPRFQLEVHLRPRPRCSRRQRRRPIYDTLTERRFEFVTLWGLAVFFLYALRRVQCPHCGVRVEAIPWARGKQQLATTRAWFLARRAQRLSWTAVAEIFHTRWTHVYHSVAMALTWAGRIRTSAT